MRKQSSAAARVADICGIIRLGEPFEKSESGPDACRGANFPELSSTALAIIPLQDHGPIDAWLQDTPTEFAGKGSKGISAKVVKEN